MTPTSLLEWTAFLSEPDMSEDLGKLLLRLTLGILILLHGISKLKGGIGFLDPMLHGIGLPPWVSYGAYIGEVLAPIMVILGFFGRTGAFLIFVNMVFAVVLVHRPDLFKLGQQGGWMLELQGMFMFTALALVLMTPGRYAITKRY
jgi:putative oxidoreductase